MYRIMSIKSDWFCRLFLHRERRMTVSFNQLTQTHIQSDSCLEKMESITSTLNSTLSISRALLSGSRWARKMQTQPPSPHTVTDLETSRQVSSPRVFFCHTYQLLNANKLRKEKENYNNPFIYANGL